MKVRNIFYVPGNILARVKRVESLATKQEVKSSAASFLWRSASSCSSSTWNLLVPEMFLVPPAPDPCFRKVSLDTANKKAQQKVGCLKWYRLVGQIGLRRGGGKFSLPGKSRQLVWRCYCSTGNITHQGKLEQAERCGPTETLHPHK